LRPIEVRPIVSRPSVFLAAALFIGLLSSAAAAAPPDISISDVAAPEGNNGNTSFNFTVTLSQAVGTDVTVDFQTANGTATLANSDYVMASSTLTIPANTLSATIAVDVVGDAVFEPDETFFVQLSNPSQGQIIDNTGLGTIEDDDPTIWIDNVAELEGNSGTTNFVFTVQLTNPLSQAVTVDFATSDGTATVGNSDYVATSGTLTIRRGKRTAHITVKVNGDTFDEGTAPELFNLTLSNPSMGTIVDGAGQGAIIDDDPLNTGVDNTPVTEFAFGNVWPNPVRGIASINYALPQQTHVRLTVFDLQGREVAVLVNEVRAAGRYTAEWAGGISYGTYFYRLQAGSFVQTRKFTFMK